MRNQWTRTCGTVARQTIVSPVTAIRRVSGHIGQQRRLGRRHPSLPGAILFEVTFYLLQLLSMIWECEPQYRVLAAAIIIPIAVLVLILAVQKLYF